MATRRTASRAVPVESVPVEELDREQYPKTLCHTDSEPGHVISRTVATPEEEAGLGGDWVPLADLGIETAPAAGSPPVAVPGVSEPVVTGVANSEIPGGTPVVAIDNQPNRAVIATVVRGVLNQPSPAGPPAPETDTEPEPKPEPEPEPEPDESE